MIRQNKHHTKAMSKAYALTLAFTLVLLLFLAHGAPSPRAFLFHSYYNQEQLCSTDTYSGGYIGLQNGICMPAECFFEYGIQFLSTS